MSEPTVICRCGGTGKIHWRNDDPPDQAIPIPGTDLVIGPGFSSGWSLCQCRRSLPPRDGEARSWDSETVYHEVATFSVFDESAEVEVKAEVPVDKDGYVLRRTAENRYWACFVDLTVSSADLGWLYPEEARELARLLSEAADKCDEIDGP